MMEKSKIIKCMKEDKEDIKRDKGRVTEQDKMRTRWKSNQEVYDLEMSNTLLRKRADMG